MPRQVFSSHIQDQVSIIEFKLDDDDDMFLTYSWGRESGPEIHRTGKGPPYVELFGGEPGQTTTHPFGLRLGSWLICAHMRDDELKDAEQELNKAKQTGCPPEDMAVLERTVKELKTITSSLLGL